MWDFLRPTKPKLWIAVVLLASYWLIGKMDSLVAFPLVNVFYPDYFPRLMEAMQPQTEKLMTLMGQDAMGATNLFLVVHMTVAAALGYLGACLIALLVKNGKAF